MKTVGFVCEGPRDSDLLAAVVSHILDEDIAALYLQPEPSLTGENGNGWKGVWSWCEKNGKLLDRYMQGAVPKIDMIIVQMDGDVARKEKEVHCSCYADECEASGTIFPLKCNNKQCPIILPCKNHVSEACEYAAHLQNLIKSYFPGEYIPICVIPCDSTDAWIVAAFEGIENIECLPDPWMNVISKSKEYHTIRVPGHKKTATVYAQFIPTVCMNWELVKSRCSQAADFESAIRENFD